MFVGVLAIADAGALLVWNHGDGAATASPVSVGQVPFVGGPADRTGPSTRPTAGAVPAPVAISIPDIGVASELTDLHLRPDGSLAVPDDFAKAGWWAEGARPGAVGPAVIVGHVDSYKGAAVFYRLRDLRPGNAVVVRRADGSSVRFLVDAVRQYDKDRFPTAAVYGPTPVASLRLVTCGGRYDARHRRYLDNVVVYAHVSP